MQPGSNPANISKLLFKSNSLKCGQVNFFCEFYYHREDKIDRLVVECHNQTDNNVFIKVFFTDQLKVTYEPFKKVNIAASEIIKVDQGPDNTEDHLWVYLRLAHDTDVGIVKEDYALILKGVDFNNRRIKVASLAKKGGKVYP